MPAHTRDLASTVVAITGASSGYRPSFAKAVGRSRRPGCHPSSTGERLQQLADDLAAKNANRPVGHVEHGGWRLMMTSPNPAVVDCVRKFIAEVEYPPVNPILILGRSDQHASRPRLECQFLRGVQP